MNNGEPFPESANKFLQAFYDAKKATTDVEKYDALVEGWNFHNAHFYEDDLKTLEFYVLTKLGII